MDRVISNEICTAIAIGFISSKKTTQTFIYDNDRDFAEHDKLKNRLTALGTTVNFVKQTGPKEDNPFITAKTKYITSDVLSGIKDDLNKLISECERKINQIKPDTALRGAYVGASSTVGDFKFYGPSNLIQYDPQYRTVDDSVKISYDTAKEVSNIIIDFLKNNIKLGIKSGIKISVNELIEIITDAYSDGKLFGSVHGMITALLENGGNIDTAAACVEIAMGKDTCKVASCIPCSIFMTSNNTPATATHLGRGDNWKLPAPKYPVNNFQVQQWRDYVIELYKAGLKTNVKLFSRCSDFVLANGDVKKVPDIFLEALTFESSFITKMLSVIA